MTTPPQCPCLEHALANPLEVDPALDLGELSWRAGGDRELVREVVVAALGETRRLRLDLGEAAQRRDLEGMRLVSHTLRGCVANLGAKPVVAHLADLEAAVAAGDASEAAEHARLAVASSASLESSITQACSCHGCPVPDVRTP